MDKIVISVIVPIYQSERYLKECLYSIQKQTFSSYEVILLNDGSTDGSEEICREFCQHDSRFLLFSQENQGVSVARNYAMTLARGKYLTFIDSDDYVGPEFLQVLYQGIRSADLSVCGIMRIDGNMQDKFSVLKDCTLTCEGGIRYCICNNDFGGYTCNKLYRKALIEQFGIGMREDLVVGEDMLFNVEYLKHCRKVTYSSLCLYCYRRNENSKLRKFNRKDGTYRIELHSNALASVLIDRALSQREVMDYASDDHAWERVRRAVQYRKARTSMWILFRLIANRCYDKEYIRGAGNVIRHNLQSYLLNTNSRPVEKLAASVAAGFPGFLYLAGVTVLRVFPKAANRYLS